MAIRVVADTHAILWYLYNDARLSTTANTLLDATDKAGGPDCYCLYYPS